MMQRRIRHKGQVTIPVNALRALGWREGTRVVFAVWGSSVVICPLEAIEAETDAAFLSDEWRERVDRSLAEVEAGLSRVFETDEAFLRGLGS